MQHIVVLWLIIVGRLVFPVVQQPTNSYWFVSKNENEVTQFQLAENITLLAHNYLAGSAFSDISVGEKLYILSENKIVVYAVRSIDYYEVLSYYSYRNIETNELVDVHWLVKKYYSGAGLTLQTCIRRGNNDTWGRMFLTAYKVSTMLSLSPTK